MTTATADRKLTLIAELSARREFAKWSVAADWAMTAASDPEAATGERPHARKYALDCLRRMIVAGRVVLNATADLDEAAILAQSLDNARKMIDRKLVFSVRGGKRAPISADAVPATVGLTGIRATAT